MAHDEEPGGHSGNRVSRELNRLNRLRVPLKKIRLAEVFNFTRIYP